MNKNITLEISENNNTLLSVSDLLETELGSRSTWIKSAAFIVYHSDTDDFSDNAHCNLLLDDEPIATYTLGELRAQPEYDVAA